MDKYGLGSARNRRREATHAPSCEAGLSGSRPDIIDWLLQNQLSAHHTKCRLRLYSDMKWYVYICGAGDLPRQSIRQAGYDNFANFLQPCKCGESQYRRTGHDLNPGNSCPIK